MAAGGNKVCILVIDTGHLETEMLLFDVCRASTHKLSAPIKIEYLSFPRKSLYESYEDYRFKSANRLGLRMMISERGLMRKGVKTVSSLAWLPLLLENVPLRSVFANCTR